MTSWVINEQMDDILAKFQHDAREFVNELIEKKDQENSKLRQERDTFKTELYQLQQKLSQSHENEFQLQKQLQLVKDEKEAYKDKYKEVYQKYQVIHRNYKEHVSQTDKEREQWSRIKKLYRRGYLNKTPSKSPTPTPPTSTTKEITQLENDISANITTSTSTSTNSASVSSAVESTPLPSRFLMNTPASLATSVNVEEGSDTPIDKLDKYSSVINTNANTSTTYKRNTKSKSASDNSAVSTPPPRRFMMNTPASLAASASSVKLEDPEKFAFLNNTTNSTREIPKNKNNDNDNDNNSKSSSTNVQARKEKENLDPNTNTPVSIPQMIKRSNILKDKTNNSPTPASRQYPICSRVRSLTSPYTSDSKRQKVQNENDKMSMPARSKTFIQQQQENDQENDQENYNARLSNSVIKQEQEQEQEQKPDLQVSKQAEQEPVPQQLQQQETDNFFDSQATIYSDDESERRKYLPQPAEEKKKKNDVVAPVKKEQDDSIFEDFLPAHNTNNNNDTDSEATDYGDSDSATDDDEQVGIEVEDAKDEDCPNPYKVNAKSAQEQVNGNGKGKGKAQVKAKKVENESSSDKSEKVPCWHDMFEINPDHNNGMDRPYNEVVRKQSERKRMDASSCDCCKGYYEQCHGNDKDAARRHQKQVSRHRHRWERPETPPGYWQMGFPDTQEVEEFNRQAREQEKRKLERMEEEARNGGRWRYRTGKS